MLGKINRCYQIMLLVEIICVILLLPGCFRKEEEVYSLQGEKLAESLTEMDGCLEFTGEKIQLLPGVYQVEVKSNLWEEQKIKVEMRCDNANFHSLLENAVVIFSGNDFQKFRFYVLDKVAEAYIQCDFYGAQEDTLIELNVYRTNKGNRVLLLTGLACFAVVDFLVIFRKRILEGSVSRKKQVIFLFLALGVLLAYFPYLTDYYSLGADTGFHLSRIARLAETLEQNLNLPIRIQSGWLYGHGYAVSMFYGDLFLLLPAGLLLSGFSLMSAYKIFVLLLLAVTAGISYHCFYRCIKSEYAALFGSLTYLLTPYYLYTLYSRGAMGEMLAMVFLPLVFCGVYLLYTEDVKALNYKKHKWYLILGVSAVLESHLISTEMIITLMAVICIIFWKRTFRKETFLQLLEATVIVLLINMWFWLPMLYMLATDRYHLQTIVSTAVQERGLLLACFFQLLPNKGSAQTGLYCCEPIQVGAGVMLLLLIYVIRWLAFKKGERNCSVMAGFGILMLFMSTQYLPWDSVMKLPVIGAVVASLQFPTRWLVMANVFLGMFAGFFLLHVQEQGGKFLRMAVGVAAVIGVVSAVYHVNDIVLQFQPTYLYEAENMGTINIGNGEYLLEEQPDFAIGMYYHDPIPEGGLYWSDYEKLGTRVRVQLENMTAEVKYLEIPLTGYHGYAVTDLSTGRQDVLCVSEKVGEHGDLRIEVPPNYRGKIEISYEGFFFFHIAEWISLISFLGIGVWYFYEKGRGLRNEKNDVSDQ